MESKPSLASAAIVLEGQARLNENFQNQWPFMTLRPYHCKAVPLHISHRRRFPELPGGMRTNVGSMQLPSWGPETRLRVVGTWQHSANPETLVASIGIDTMAMYGVC